MTSPIKISSLELENVKRIRAVELEPTKDGLTVIGGRNAQGKTSVLDAIAWALGGEKMRPASPNRDGSANPAHLLLRLSNGITVERKGKNGALYVTDTTGRRAGQTLLNEFIALLKETSVAGYVGVVDLTRAGNAIRGATFSAFMPLIAVALIYLAIVLILTKIVGVIERRLRKSER